MIPTPFGDKKPEQALEIVKQGRSTGLSQNQLRRILDRLEEQMPELARQAAQFILAHRSKYNYGFRVTEKAEFILDTIGVIGGVEIRSQPEILAALKGIMAGDKIRLLFTLDGTAGAIHLLAMIGSIIEADDMTKLLLDCIATSRRWGHHANRVQTVTAMPGFDADYFVQQLWKVLQRIEVIKAQ